MDRYDFPRLDMLIMRTARLEEKTHEVVSSVRCCPSIPNRRLEYFRLTFREVFFPGISTMAAFVWGNVRLLFLTYSTAPFVHVDAECPTQPLGGMMT